MQAPPADQAPETPVVEPTPPVTDATPDATPEGGDA
jgi:hypothetical protein